MTVSNKNDLLLELVQSHKADNKAGIYAICSSNKFVLKAAMGYAKRKNSLLLIEATSNQVDQFGGYMNMTPIQYRHYIKTIINETDFSEDKVILGGDHLGTNVWQNLPSEMAMENSRNLIKAYVKAGFKKIHLDTSFPCINDDIDKSEGLSKKIISQRSADLCKVAEEEIQYSDLPGKIVYVIGTEVPTPGGMSSQGEKIPEVSTVDSTEETITLTKDAFYALGLEDAWERVIAVVTQPGVEFGDNIIIEYDRNKTADLVKYIESYNNLVFEAHSTDYQSEHSLKELVEDHFAILKVGPALTYALREILYALESIEVKIFYKSANMQVSDLSNVTEAAMLNNPKYWINHYSGTKNEIAYSRRHSLSDRIRYYWSNPAVNNSIQRLVHNLSSEVTIPDALLEEKLTDQYSSFQNGEITNNPEALIAHKIQQIIKPYADACGMS